MSEDSKNSKKLSVDILRDQAKETQKGLQKIIEIWKMGMKDPEVSMRFFTIMVTLLGFVLLIILLLFIGDCVVCILDKNKTINLYIYLVSILITMLVIVPITVYAVLKLSDRAQSKMLEKGFDNIYDQRRGTTNIEGYG